MNENQTMEQSQAKDQDNLDMAITQDPYPNAQDSINKEAIGTFQNSEELLKAYKNLFADYTRKSQELSTLRKRSGQDASDARQESIEPAIQALEKPETPPISIPAIMGAGAQAPSKLGNTRSLRESDNLAKSFFTTKK